jgi:predicted O-methyltransferase YrrM
MSLKNIVWNFFKLSYIPVMSRKIIIRMSSVTKPCREVSSLQWCKAAVEDFHQLADQLDSVLWKESKEFAQRLYHHAADRLACLDVQLGGGGHYEFLYFVTRLYCPEVIVETGVAAGFSSLAFLEAIEANGVGRLYSSDFPYFRLRNPEQYIGILVNEQLKKRWELFIEGDRKNLKKIRQQISHIDLFHYDSDKSYVGRKFGMSFVENLIADNGLVVMDDIQDNSYFRDYVEDKGCPYRVFEFEGKYIGVIGL